MKKISKIIIGTLVVLGISSAVIACSSHYRFSHMNMQDKAEHVNNFLSRRLELNSEQQNNLQSMTDRVAEIISAARTERAERQKFINDLIDQPNLDQSALLQRINEKTAMVNDHAPEVVALLGQFVDSLDAEQKAQLKQMINRRHGGHGFGSRFNHHFGSRDDTAWNDN